MKKCGSCGNTIPEQMSFCSVCGTKYEAPTSSSMVCGACSTVNESGSAFCTKCGKRLYESPASSSMVCGACSTVNELGSAFCKKCGKSLGAQTSAAVGKVSSSLTFLDFLPMALGLFSILLFEYYIGIAGGVGAVVLGIKELKTERKWFGIAGIVLGAIGILASFGEMLG